MMPAESNAERLATMNTQAANSGFSYSVPLLEGDAGTEQTVELMRQVVRAGLQDPLVWQTARRIYPCSIYGDDLDQVKKVFAWVKKNIRFMRDPYGQETVSTPERTLKQTFGDCDDITVLMGALLGSLGYRTRIVTVASHPHTEQFTHVYLEVMVRGRYSQRYIRLCRRYNRGRRSRKEYLERRSRPPRAYRASLIFWRKKFLMFDPVSERPRVQE